MGSSKKDDDRRFRSIEDVKSEFLPVSSKGMDELVRRTADVTQSALKKHVKGSMRD